MMSCFVLRVFSSVYPIRSFRPTTNMRVFCIRKCLYLLTLYLRNTTIRRRNMASIRLKLTYLLYKVLRKLGIKTDEIYYIGGSEALPPPLTKEEEELLLEKLPKGDETARALLIERNLRLVVYIARKFENTGINIEDLI